jgi:hypothetical protein
VAAPDAALTLVPEAVRTARYHDEQGDWIISTFEVTHEGEQIEAQVVLSPDDFVAWIVAALNALGYPEGDCEYIAARWAREQRGK